MLIHLTLDPAAERRQLRVDVVGPSVFLYVDGMNPQALDASSLLARAGKERDFYSKLLELGQADEIEPFLVDALGLIVEISGAQRGYVELMFNPDDRQQDRAQKGIFSEEDRRRVEAFARCERAASLAKSPSHAYRLVRAFELAACERRVEEARRRVP